MLLRTAFVFALCSAIPASAATVYMNTAQGQFGTIDLSTGNFTLIGVTSVQLAGLGEVGGNLYGASAGSVTLYQINPANGHLTSIGNDSTGFSYVDFGSAGTGLYAMDFSFNLYSVNPSTGATSLIGPTGLSPGGNYQLSTGSSTLYFTAFADAAHGNFTEELFTINTTTGLATAIGPTGGPQMGGLVVAGSTLYGGQTNPSNNVDTLNTSTGAATAGPALSGTSSGASNFDGLAPLLGSSSAPEPGTWSLLAAGLALLVCIKQRVK